MELRQAEAFFWIATLGSFTAAAKRLFITQSAISSRIHALEIEVGEPLILRGGSHLRLTGRGREFLEQSKRLLELAAEMGSSTQGRGAHERGSQKPGLRGTVRIGAVNTIAQTWLPLLIREVGQAHPAVDVDLHVGISSSITQRLLRSDVDVAFIAEPLIASGVQTRLLGRYPLGWVTSIVWPEGVAVTLEALSKYRLMTYERGTTLHRLISEMFRHQGVSPVRLSGTNSVAAMVELALHGVGICALPIPVVTNHVRSGRLHVLNAMPALPKVDFYMAHGAPTNNQLALAIIDIASRLHNQGQMEAG